MSALQGDETDWADAVAEPISVTDGLVRIRPPEAGERQLLLTEQARTLPGLLPDDDIRRKPTGVIIVGNQLAGWVGYDADRDWLGTGEVLVHCNAAGPRAGGDGYALRALQLLMHHLATRTSYRTAVLAASLQDPHARSLAATAGFAARGALTSDQLYERAVPPLTYADGVVTIRRQRIDDIGAHLEAIDDEQIDWLWEPGDREKWEALAPDEQRARNLRHLRASHDSFGAGPKWTFSVDGRGADYIAYIDCDLANDHVPAGEANIAYTAHPAHREQGNVSRAVRLIAQFLRDHTGAERAHIIVDAENTASLRVARAVAAESGRWQNEHGRTMIRHILTLR